MCPSVVCDVVLECRSICSLFFFNDTATTEIYTLSLHDALPISVDRQPGRGQDHAGQRHRARARRRAGGGGDRKSTRLNSSHGYISYAVFCLKKKKRRRKRKIQAKQNDDG